MTLKKSNCGWLAGSASCLCCAAPLPLVGSGLGKWKKQQQQLSGPNGLLVLLAEAVHQALLWAVNLVVYLSHLTNSKGNVRRRSSACMCHGRHDQLRWVLLSDAPNAAGSYQVLDVKGLLLRPPPLAH